MALSGRALAAAAVRSGYAPLVADLFGDDDGRALARRHETVPGSLRHGFRPHALRAALDRLVEGEHPVGLVYGAGLEDRPGTLRRLARAHHLLGNTPNVVRRVKDPDALAALAVAQGVPHPPIRRAPPDDDGWLRKRAGGSGGAHVRPADAARAAGRRVYWQRLVPGTPVSALVLADGAAAWVLGLSEQWAEGGPDAPFRYAGAVRPALATPHDRPIQDAAVRLARVAGLRGLCSIDFMVSGDGFHMLEVNPRPGASLDVFIHPALLRLHVEATQGRLPDTLPTFTGAAAAAVVYAPVPLAVAAGFGWPDWAADRQPAGRPVPAGAPLCTVLAEATTADEARRLVAERRATILARVGA